MAYKQHQSKLHPFLDGLYCKHSRSSQHLWALVVGVSSVPSQDQQQLETLATMDPWRVSDTRWEVKLYHKSLNMIMLHSLLAAGSRNI